MGVLDRNTECCGANFENNNISILGLFLVSCPFIIFYWILFPLTLTLHFVSKGKSIFSIIHRANNDLVRKAQIYPKLKCSISGKLYGVSPFLSGWVFRYFNLTCLMMAWVLLTGLFVGVKFLWP